MKLFVPSFVVLASLGLVCLTAGAPGCTSSFSDEDAASATSEALTARSPIPFGLQFVATYSNPDAATGDLASVQILRNGRFVASYAGDNVAEKGVYRAPSKPGLPYTFHFITRGHAWVGTVAAYDGTLSAVVDGSASVLHADGPVGPNESLCDATGGSWADDDPDPATGLFCVCQASTVYIPSAGGCVH